MLYLVLLSALVSLVTTVIAQDVEPANDEGSDALGEGSSALAPVALTDSEREDLEALAA